MYIGNCIKDTEFFVHIFETAIDKTLDKSSTNNGTIAIKDS